MGALETVNSLSSVTTVLLGLLYKSSGRGIKPLIKTLHLETPQLLKHSEAESHGSPQRRQRSGHGAFHSGKPSATEAHA